MITKKSSRTLIDQSVKLKHKVTIRLLALVLILMSFTVRKCSGGKTHEESPITSYATWPRKIGSGGGEMPNEYRYSGGERWREGGGGGGGHDTRKGRSVPEESE